MKEEGGRERGRQGGTWGEMSEDVLIKRRMDYQAVNTKTYQS